MESIHKDTHGHNDMEGHTQKQTDKCGYNTNTHEIILLPENI